MKIRYLLKKVVLGDKEKKYVDEKIKRFEKYFKNLTESTRSEERR